jgi:predicted phosphodiesterase
VAGVEAPVLFAGDPHRNFSPIIRACQAHKPGALIIVGDCDCPAPLPEIMAPLLDRGWRVFWILGNHDTDSEATFDHLTRAHPEGDLGLGPRLIGGLRIGGLPGVFKPRVWHPRGGPDERVDPPRFQTRSAFQASLRPDELWRGGLPLWHRDTIFPEDIATLAAERCDILVTHEAPSSHEHGFSVLDDLAARCRARLIVHGHHHRAYTATLANGVAVRGLGLGEVYRLEAS